jgi:glutamate--cysteine ligase
MLDTPLAADRIAYFEQLSQQSLQDQARIEAADTMPFDVYLQEYLSPLRLVVKQGAN